MNIRNKVQRMERRLDTPTDGNDDAQDAKPVVIVSCNGTDEKLVKTIKKYENDLSNTNSFKDAVKPLFQYVKKQVPMWEVNSLF